MKVKMMNLWMQIEDRKLIFIMNFSVLDFFKFASRMPQTAQILVSTFRIFRGGHAPGPPRYFLFFPLAILRIWVLKFLFFSADAQWLSFGWLLLIGWKVCCTPDFFFFFFFFFLHWSIPTFRELLTVAVRWLGTFANILFLGHQNDILNTILRMTK